MVPRLTSLKTLAGPASDQRSEPLAMRIRHQNIAIARGPQGSIQPRDLPFQVAPFRIHDHRRKERHGGAQPCERDAHLMHSLRVAGDSASVARLYPCDAVKREFPERRCTIKAGWRG